MLDDDFLFRCSVCHEERLFKLRYLDEKNNNVCASCLLKKGYFTTIQSMPYEESHKLGVKLMRKGNIPENHLVVARPNPADDIEIRLNKVWDESGNEPLFKYSVTDIPLTLREPGTRPKLTESVRVLIIEDSKYGFFNLQWLDHVLKQKPRIKIVNTNFFTRNNRIRIEIFPEYVDKPPEYTIKPMKR